MNDSANNERTLVESEKPVHTIDDVKLPPFPDPSNKDFDEDISEEEKTYYKNKFADLNNIRNEKVHCTACDRHIGCSANNEGKLRVHPLLRTLVCQTCHTFYNSGEFEKGDDGSELYCRWCGQGGQVFCCSDCPHVFCARCIRRNMGAPKIKEIENADDWKCFLCNPKCLWDLRSICWALLRFCDLKNKLVLDTEDPDLKEAYLNYCSRDDSKCCKPRLTKRKEKEILKKKEEIRKPNAANMITRLPSTIQVKKFASINLDVTPKPEKKPLKRPISPKHKPAILKNPLSIQASQVPKIKNPNVHVMKKIKLQPVVSSYSRIRPKGPVTSSPMPIPIITGTFNGFHNSQIFSNSLNNISTNDNINLSLENLTQGLDMASMTALPNNNDNDVVCTPDFPMEQLCEITEDDDDVQCITPNQQATPSRLSTNPPPLVPRTGNIIPEINSDNIIQMTENDVTVNDTTGGLKFRVDPQTLSSNKMYRLPDGRIFAINANPHMPGGYSATIVALAEVNSQTQPRGITYAAKLSSVTSANTVSSLSPQELSQSTVKCKKVTLLKKPNEISRKPARSTKQTENRRECDLNVPVEWYRYNLIDAVDALEYSQARLMKLKKQATTMYLRTRSVGEMRSLHRSLERLLNTSSSRFMEIKDNLNKGLRQYIIKKMGGTVSDDDDDDVEILPDLDNDDPIFIDENSVDSNANESQEVDLTAASSDHNGSGENRDELCTMQEEHLDDDDDNSNIFQREHTQGIARNDRSALKHSRKQTTDKQIQLAGDASEDVDKSTRYKNGINSKDQDTIEVISNQASSPKNCSLTNTMRGSKLPLRKCNADMKSDKPEDSDVRAAENDITSNEISDKLQNRVLDNDPELHDGETSEDVIKTLLKEKGDGQDEVSSLTCLEELQDS